MQEQLVHIICEEIDKQDLLKFVKSDRDFEKRVRAIVSEVVMDMFRVLWQHNGIFKVLGK